ncbi:50S ribosomal protein L4 [Methanobacterium sp. CWC-01]|jgi:large subunit ribosomal protein L4e|uniref:50S ribosomal protein L4 n=1 Tax=Methanobacterium aridiramus TaxID=2584467 RepID=UPI00257860C6|nr:50S ribosomal protein L4 [Methanobacterium sp. CWC-01]WJI10220.1 50S ribosomal protein L4 [Methanobacterium sp. CWC-01]
MKKVKVYSLEGDVVDEMELPEIFTEEYRPDLIKRAVLSAQAARIQPWGTDPMAGKRTTAQSYGAGRGVAMVPRVKGSRHPAGSKAAFVPQATGGRRAHPPRVARTINEKINKKERRLAIRSAVAATADQDIVEARGHQIENVPQVPLVVDDDICNIRKTKETREIFKKLGLMDDVVRAKNGKNIRSGRGKTRGRKYKTPRGPLLVVGEDKGISKAARNHPGVEVVVVDNLNAELLAPGTHPGRLTLYTRSAVEKLGELFKNR